MAAWYLPLGTALRSSKSLKPNNLAKLRITPNRSEQFGVMLRRGKMDRRRQRLRPSAPDFLYKEASPKSYDSAKSPEKPLATGAFRPDGVKKSLLGLYQILVGMVAEKEGFEPSRQLSHPTPLAGEPLRPLGYFSTSRFWRRERDSNPRCLAASLVFKTSALNHSAISPQKTSATIIAKTRRPVKGFFENLTV